MPKSKSPKCRECKRRSAIVKLNGKWVCLKCFKLKLTFFHHILVRAIRRLR